MLNKKSNLRFDQAFLYDIFRLIVPEFLVLVATAVNLVLNVRVHRNNVKFKRERSNHNNNNTPPLHEANASVVSFLQINTSRSDHHHALAVAAQLHSDEKRQSSSGSRQLIKAKFKITPIERMLKTIFPIIAQLVFLVILFACATLHPSILSVPYALSFILLIARWSLDKRLIETRFQLVLKLVVLVYAALHILLVYLYQFHLFQLYVTPGGLATRLTGLTQILYSQCTQPAHFFFNWENFRVEQLIHPFTLILLYWFLAIEFSYTREQVNTYIYLLLCQTGQTLIINHFYIWQATLQTKPKK